MRDERATAAAPQPRPVSRHRKRRHEHQVCRPDRVPAEIRRTAGGQWLRVPLWGPLRPVQIPVGERDGNEHPHAALMQGAEQFDGPGLAAPRLNSPEGRR